MKRSFLFCGLFLALLAPDCQAAVDSDVVTRLANQFYTVSRGYGAVLEQYAQGLFKWCLILDVALLGIRAALGRQEFGDTIKQFIMVLLFAGFCLAVITHYQEWTGNIINGLKGIATALSGADLTLSPFNTGLEIAANILEKMDSWDPAKALGYLIAAGVIMACFALITARILLVKCEAYIAMNAAVLLLGFGGSGLLKEYAINTMRYALSVAFKLFVMQLVLGIGMSFVNSFRAASAVTYEELIVVIGCAVVLLVLIDKIPEVCAGIITGSHHGGGTGLGAAGSAVAAGVGGAVGGAVGGMAAGGRGLSSIKAALDVAGPQGQGKTGWARGAQAAKNVYDSFSTARRQENAYGSTGQRMNSILKDQRDVSRAQATPPQQPHPPQDAQD
jgi:type IV secretion system protein TrbL